MPIYVKYFEYKGIYFDVVTNTANVSFVQIKGRCDVEICRYKTIDTHLHLFKIRLISFCTCFWQLKSVAYVNIHLSGKSSMNTAYEVCKPPSSIHICQVLSTITRREVTFVDNTKCHRTLILPAETMTCLYFIF